MRNLIVATAAGLMTLSGVAQAQNVQPDSTRPTNTNIAAPADKASDPPRNPMPTGKAAPMPGAKASAVGSGSAGTAAGRKDGTTNSNSKGEPSGAKK